MFQHYPFVRLSALFGLIVLLPMLLLMTATPLLAGGWVVVTLDELPRAVRAGEPVVVRFTVRQHGQTLVQLTGTGPVVEARNIASGEEIAVTAQRDGFTGHYSAEVIFPTGGTWAWQITPHPFPTFATMPPLTVQDDVDAVREAPVAYTVDENIHPLLQWLAVVQQWFVQVALAGEVAPTAVTSTEPVASTERTEERLIAYGHDLFLAKGCASCHVHDEALVEWNSQSGPDLTAYDKTATYLQLWLTDPAGVKPTTEMPNLDLDAAEIEALAAFLTATE